MTLRDIRMPAAHFQKVRAIFDEGQGDLTRILTDVVLPDEQVDVAHELFELSLFQIINRFSQDESLTTLTPAIADLLPLRQQLSDAADKLPAKQQVYRKAFEMFGGQGSACGSTNSNRYRYALWWLSLVVATQPKAHQQQVLALIGNAGRDVLLDCIIREIGGEVKDGAAELLYPRCYAPLLAVFEANKNERPQAMNDFLTNWYVESGDADWHDCLARQEDAMTYPEFYVGYWCFEAALVVNLLHMDDHLFRNNPYYPHDLLRATGPMFRFVEA